MGKRARGGGFTNAAVRAARAVARERDEHVAAIAEAVYAVGHDLKRSGFRDDALPPAVFVPLLSACEAAAPGAAKLAGLEVTEDSAREVAAYLLAGCRELIVMLDPAHFAGWRAARDKEDGGNVESPSAGAAGSVVDAAAGSAGEGESRQDVSG